MTSSPIAPQNTLSRSPSNDRIFDVFSAEPPVCDDKKSHLNQKNLGGKSIEYQSKHNNVRLSYDINYLLLAFSLTDSNVSDEHSPKPFGSKPYSLRISGNFVVQYVKSNNTLPNAINFGHMSMKIEFNGVDGMRFLNFIFVYTTCISHNERNEKDHLN